MSKGIGFTEDETEKVLSYYGLEDYHVTAQKNYDGYSFGDVHMFCPWDVMSFCKENREKTGKENGKITAGNYWINTSGNDIIEEFMGFIGPEDIKKMQSLMDGESIEVEVRETLCYGDLKNHDINDFWTLMLYTGYLTFNPQYRSPEKGKYRLYIPNEEIKECFKSKILNFYKNNTVMKNRTDDLIKGLFTGDAELVENSLSGLLAKYVSIRDFSTRAPKENYYQGFMNGLLINGGSLIENHQSNMESGNGYADMILLSKDKTDIAVLELKIAAGELDDRVSIAEKAVEQIIDKKYAGRFIENKTIKSVYAYGICFYQKVCSVVVKKLK